MDIQRFGASGVGGGNYCNSMSRGQGNSCSMVSNNFCSRANNVLGSNTGNSGVMQAGAGRQIGWNGGGSSVPSNLSTTINNYYGGVGQSGGYGGYNTARAYSGYNSGGYGMAGSYGNSTNMGMYNSYGSGYGTSASMVQNNYGNTYNFYGSMGMNQQYGTNYGYGSGYGSNYGYGNSYGSGYGSNYGYGNSYGNSYGSGYTQSNYGNTYNYYGTSGTSSTGSSGSSYDASPKNGSLSESDDVLTYTTTGGWQVAMDGTTVKLTSADGSDTTTIWGDPHVKEADGSSWTWDDKTSSFLLSDGTKITMNATAADGTLTSTSIYDKASCVSYDNTDGSYTYTTDGKTARKNDSAEDDGTVYTTNNQGNDWTEKTS